MNSLLHLSYLLLKNLPLPVYYCFGDIMFFLLYYITRYRRRVVRKNLTGAYPAWTPQKVRSVEKKFYRHLADYMIESAAMIRMTGSDYTKRFRFINLDLYHECIRNGKNVLIASGHYGNWEWVISLPLYSDTPTYAVYKEQSNQFINSAMLYAREKNGMRLLSYPRVYKEIVALPPGKNIAVYMLADQRPKMENKAKWIRFMNRNISCFRGLENLDKAMQGVVLYAQIVKIKRGHYTVEFIPLKSNDHDNPTGDNLTEKYFRALEDNIAIDPAFYLWSHNRWKFIKPEPADQ